MTSASSSKRGGVLVLSATCSPAEEDSVGLRIRRFGVEVELFRAVLSSLRSTTEASSDLRTPQDALLVIVGTAGGPMVSI